MTLYFSVVTVTKMCYQETADCCKVLVVAPPPGATKVTLLSNLLITQQIAVSLHDFYLGCKHTHTHTHTHSSSHQADGSSRLAGFHGDHITSVRMPWLKIAPPFTQTTLLLLKRQFSCFLCRKEYHYTLSRFTSEAKDLFNHVK